MSPLRILICGTLVLASPIAQVKPKRSSVGRLALVLAGAEGLVPAKLESGLPLEKGPGPRVLIVRKNDGKLEVVRIPRGKADVVAHPRRAVAAIEEEEIEEEEVPIPKEERKKDRKKKPKLRKRPVARGKVPAESSGKSEQSPSIELKRNAGVLLVQSLRNPDRFYKGKLDRNAVRRLLAKLRDSTVAEVASPGRRTRFPRKTVTIRTGKDVSTNDFLAVWDLARSVGFEHLLIDAGRSTKPLSLESVALLEKLPKKLGWKRNTRHTYPGEILFLIGGGVPWAEVVPLYYECAKLGVYRIALVGRGAKKTTVKVPTHLPLDV